MIEIKHNCIYCALRHYGCAKEFWEQSLLNNCPKFEVGKCFKCKYNVEEPEGICLAEDMSGYGCPNFTE